MRFSVEQYVSALPYARALGIELVTYDAASGQCVLRLPWREDLVGDPESGVLHGGAITGLLDTLGFACAVARDPRVTATLDLRIDYLRAATPRLDLVGDATCYRVTRHVAFVRGHCHQGDPARAVANLTATFILTEAKP